MTKRRFSDPSPIKSKSFTLSPRPCPVCKADYRADRMASLFEQRFEALQHTYLISQCMQCGFIHQNPAYQNDFYLSLYEFFGGLYTNPVYRQTNYRYHPDKIKRYKSVASIIGGLSSFSMGAKILDFGCHNGAFIAWVKENIEWGAKVEFVGYDIYLRGIPEGSNFYNTLETLRATSNKFDVIVLNYVLEHLLEPLEFLTLLKDSFLQEGGRLVFEVPDVSFLMKKDFAVFQAQHTNYFTPETATKLLNKAGLAPESMYTFKNYDIDREPYAPSLLAVSRNDGEYLKDSRSLETAVALRRQQFQENMGRLADGASVGIVGGGDALFLVHRLLNKIKLVGLFDNNKKLWGTEMFGCKVRPVEEVKNCECDVILVCSLYKPSVEQIVEQLLQYVSLNKIITFID